MLKSDAALHATRQIGSLARLRIGLHLGLIEQVEHALRTRQRALQRVESERQLRHGFGRLVDKLEERLEHADGHVTGDQHAAAHERNHDLRQATNKANRGSDGVDHKVGLGAHAGQLARGLVHLGRALVLAIECANHQTARIAFLDRARDFGHPLLTLARHIMRTARNHLGHQQRYRRKTQKDQREPNAIDEHHDDGTRHGTDRYQQLQQSALHTLGHLVQVVGRAADHLTGAMCIKVGERQAAELLRDAVAQAQVESLGHTRHQKALQRIERPGSRPDQEVDKDGLAALVPGDAEGGSAGKRHLYMAPQLVDNMSAICRRGGVKDDVEHDARKHDVEAPMVAGSLAPQAAHRRPGIAGFLVLILVVHIAHALCFRAGTLVLGTLVFLVQRLAASLTLGRGLGNVIQLGRRGSLLDRFGRVRSGGIDSVAALLELLGHATHLPSSAIPRWRGIPHRFP